jgi:hypothetical protein
MRKQTSKNKPTGVKTPNIKPAVKKNGKDVTETVQTISLLPTDVMERFGANLLVFLNKPGTSPAFTKETLNEHKSWQECCSIAMALSAKTMVLASVAQQAEEQKDGTNP